MNSIGQVNPTYFDGQNLDAVLNTIGYWMAMILIWLL